MSCGIDVHPSAPCELSADPLPFRPHTSGRPPNGWILQAPVRGLMLRREALVPNYIRRVRRIGLIVAGIGSGLLGLVVAWTFVRPGVIGGVGNGALLAILGLLVLPAVVYWTWSADTRAATRQAARMRSLAEAALSHDRLNQAPLGAHSRAAGREAGAHVHAAEPRRDRAHRAGTRAATPG